MALIDMTHWVAGFCERLMKEMIVFEAREMWDKSTTTAQKEADVPRVGPSPLPISTLYSTSLIPF